MARDWRNMGVMGQGVVGLGRALESAAWVVLTAAIAIGAGCGSRASTPSGDGSDGTGAGTDVSAPSTSAPDAADAADDAGLSSDTGALLSPCRFDAPAEMARAVLAVAVDGGIVLVMSDGSMRAAYQFTSTRPLPGTLFSIRLAHLGTDIAATGTWWGDGDPSSCELRDGLLWCPETDRFVRITPDGEVVGQLTSRTITSSPAIGGGLGPDGDAGTTAAPVIPAPPDPASFTWAFPDALVPMSRLIDSQGWFVAVLRDDYRAGVYRSPDAVSGWTRLGKTLGQVEQVLVSNVAGTYVLDARGTSGFFVPQQLWQDAPVGEEPDLLQSSRQLVRPATGAADVLDDDAGAIAVDVSSDGLCAASWEPTPSGRQLTVHDLTTTSAARRVLLLEKVGIGSPGSLWVD